MPRARRYRPVELRSGRSTIFADCAIVNDVGQSLEGVARSESDLRFQFNFATQSDPMFDIMCFGTLLSGAKGTT